MDKIKLLKIKLKYLSKNLRGKKRIQFILFYIALIAYFATSNTLLVAILSGMLRDILKDTSMSENLDDYFD